MCGDLGIDTYCAGTEALPDAPSAVVPLYNDVEPDYEAPDTPTVSGVVAKAGGRVSMTITAEKGSTVEVQEDGTTVATKKGTGKKQKITFTAATGSHSYLMTATDAAGNTSYEGDAVTVTADATKPAATVAVHRPTPLEGAASVAVTTESGAAYTVAVTGQKAITGTGTGSPITHQLWLRNGTYRATVTSTDPAGNVTRVARTLNVANPTAALTVTQTSVPFHSPVEYRVVGTPRSRGQIAVPGLTPETFTLDDSGATTLSLPLEDGSYRAATATLTDFAGRSARAAVPATVVDTTEPALSVNPDATRAQDGTLLLTLVAEKAARVTVRAIRRANNGDADAAGAFSPISDTLAGTGATQAWSRTLESGTYEITTTAVDSAGNQSTLTRTVTVTRPATAGEIAAGFGILLALLGLLVTLLVVLWRKRHWIAATGERRRAAAAARAHQSAVAAAQTEYAAAQTAHRHAMARFDDAERRWQTRAAELTGLVSWALTPLLPHTGDTHGLRLRPTETLHATLPSTLVEERTKQGQPHRVSVTPGHAVVTSDRVAFRGGRNRDWVYAQLEHVTVESGGTVLMTVSTRKTTSGVHMAGTPATIERGQLLILRAIHAATGDESTVYRDLTEQQRTHASSRPVPPPPPARPAILDADPEGAPVMAGTVGEPRR
ncbi:hypothetical protein ASH01_14385 [Terrabacter sp. Soil811]|uniref:hypothetical protein n=1 Tax=Terrabacter sp. Soil811 TaxID=1736419 RepID=UPI0006F7DDFA|nr:hypothetical protein [Terrabacter sp. Soil811]KRF45107.1 hypothetical protein ASH01_14385 [Terrabacter sp. Soil811]